MGEVTNHWKLGLLVALIATSLSFTPPMGASAQEPMMPVERGKILSATGVFGVFSVLKLRPEWGMLKSSKRQKAAEEAKAVIDRHKARVLVDAYLTRGLTESSDFFLRVHAHELAAAQTLLNEFLGTTLGRNTKVTETFVGVTKPLNYTTEARAPDLLKQLRAASYQGPPPKYVIVIPTKKNAEWWNLPSKRRLEEIRSHTIPTLGFLTTVKRKLYHASGLDDLDFITYFETNDLTAFNNLVISLLSVPENTYNVRLGSPTLLGTIHSVDEVLAALAE